MIKSGLQFLNEFYQNSGTWILVSTLFNKIVLFVIKIIVLIWLEKAIFGQISYAITLIAFFTPFVGLGSPAGLLRFGSIEKDEKQRKIATDYAFTIGLINTIISITILYVVFYFLERDEQNIWIFICILIWRMLSLYLNSHQSVQMRINGQNKLFGLYDICNSLLLLLLAIGFTYFFKAEGYLLALVLSPVIIFIIFSIKYGFPKFEFTSPFGAKTKSFWNYSLLSSFTSVISQIVFFLDIFIIKQYMQDVDVAEYSAATLIPLNILVLPLIFMRTDFTKIAQNEKNPTFLRNYFYNYFRIFLVLCIVGMLASYFLGEWLFGFLGSEYQPFNLFMILMIGACSAILLRVPLTGIISALGHAKVNTITGIITLVVALILNIILIKKYGLVGTAWATTISLSISGLMSWIYFEWYLRKSVS